MKELAKNAIAGTKTVKKILAFKTWLFSWGWIAILVVLGLFFGLIMFLTVQLAFQDNSSGSTGDFGDISGGGLSEATLAWQGDVEAELSRQGLDPAEWTIITLGIIQAESGGNAETTPDIMQSSESLGEEMNTITDPLESIRVGVTALSNAISAAEQYGIKDTKAILQAYNFNTGYLKAMSEAGETEFDINFAQEYSKNIVYPAVTGKSPSSATQVSYITAWSQEVGIPWRWYNGGNFHYPNIIYYYIAGASGGAIDLGGTFISPFPNNYIVTSEFGYRIHPISGQTRLHAGIDLVSQTDKIVRSIGVGRVVQSANSSGWGNYVVIDHGVKSGYRYYSLYAHLRSPGLPIGATVTKGTIIGREGSTGASTGSHLHLEIIRTTPEGTWIGASRINPRQVIPFK